MKAFLLLFLVFGLVLAKPYENVEERLLKILDDDEEMDPVMTTSSAEPSSAGPSRPVPSGPEPSKPGPSQPGPSARPKPKGLWEKFLHFLLVKSVHGVKPDENPDLKYKKPGEELVEQLLVIKKEVVKAITGPLKNIMKLMKEDWEEMFKRVRKAVEEQNMSEAEHVVGEYFIALNRRFAMLVIEANNLGLFHKIKNESTRVKREMDEHVKKARSSVMYILKNFNQYRVNDGLLDAPFVQLGIATAKVYGAAFWQTVKNAKIAMQVYTDIVSDMVHLSLEEHNHHAAVHKAGASVLSFIRRETKVIVALRRMYGPKQCRGPNRRPNRRLNRGPNRRPRDD